MRRLILTAAAVLALGAGAVVYTKAMAWLAPGTPPVMATPADQADRIRVEKSARRLHLYRGTQLMRSYDIALGGAPADGPKAQEGDERTPEGSYRIDWRNPGSVAHLSLHISYPDATDMAAAQAAGVSPGGNIMIHGLPNGWGWLGRAHLMADWTDGCIAVTNAEMVEIWALVPDGTVIEILP